MPKHRGPIFLDNNTIGHAVDLGVWRQLLGAYQGQLETVRTVEEEAGTYFRSKPEVAELMASLGRLIVHDVTTGELTNLAVATQGIALDAGERDLLANAYGRDGGWILCGPDKATIRALVRLGRAERLVSLERLLNDGGINCRNLKECQTEAWLRRTVTEITMKER